MSYAGAGEPAPGIGTDNSATFFKAMFDHVFAQHNADDAVIVAATVSGAINQLLKTNGSGGTTLTGALFGPQAVLTSTSTGDIPLVLRGAPADPVMPILFVQNNAGSANKITLNSDGSALFAGSVTALSLTVGQILGSNGIFITSGTTTVPATLYAPLGQTQNLLMGFVNNVAQFWFGPNGSLTTLGAITAGSGAVALTDATGKILSAALNTVRVPQGGTGKATGTAGSLVVWNGTSDLTELAPGASGNILTSTGTGWASSSGISGISFANGTIPFSKVSEGHVSASGADLVLTINAMKFNDQNGIPVSYPGGTYTIPAVQVPDTGHNAWVLIYMSANGAVGSVASAFGSSPSRPNALPNTETLNYAYLRANTTAILNADDATAGHGYLEGGWRNPWSFGGSDGGGGSIATPVAVSLGGTGAGDITTARTNLAAAASGVNNDITKLTKLTQIATGTYFGAGAAGFGLPPAGVGQLEAYSSDTMRNPAIVTSASWPSGSTVADVRPSILQNITYRATSTVGIAGGAVGMIQGIYVGVGASQGTPVVPTGNVTGFASGFTVNNSDAFSEYCPFYADVTFATNNAGNTSTTPGRGWLTDYHMSGAIRQRQSSFGGVHMTMANYYDGSPSGIIYSTPSGNPDVQTVHPSASITGGTFTLTWASFTTAAIAPGDSAATVSGKIAAAGIPYIATNGPLSSGTDLTLTCTVIGVIGIAFTVTPTSITGGTLSIVRTTAGASGTYFSPSNALGGGTGIEAPSGAYWAVTEPTRIADAAHSPYPTLPLDVGYGVVGYSGSGASTYSTSTRGWTIGFLAGSHGSNWGTPFSHLGYGMWIQDFDAAGIRIAGQHPSAPAGTPAIQIDNGAGGIVIGSGSNALRSTILGTVAGALGTTAGNKLQLASFGMTTANTSHLGIYGQRVTSGTTWTTAAVVLQLDVDSSPNLGGLLAITPAGVGIGGVAAQNVISQLNTFSGSLTYTAIANGASQQQTLSGLSGLTVGDPVSVGFSANLASGLTAFAQVSSATTITVTIANTSGGSLTPGTVTAKVVCWH